MPPGRGLSFTSLCSAVLTCQLSPLPSLHARAPFSFQGMQLPTLPCRLYSNPHWAFSQLTYDAHASPPLFPPLPPSPSLPPLAVAGTAMVGHPASAAAAAALSPLTPGLPPLPRVLTATRALTATTTGGEGHLSLTGGEGAAAGGEGSQGCASSAGSQATGLWTAPPAGGRG